MEILVGGDNSKFHVKEHTIRKKRVSYEEPDEAITTPHFQAVVTDRRKNKDKPILCRLRYEDERGNFLGLENEMFFDVDDSDEMYVDIPIDVPDSAARAIVVVLERRPDSFMERHELLIASVVVVFLSALVVLAAKGLFGWQ